MKKQDKPEHLKNYKFVHERILDFNEDYENGSITCTYEIDKEWQNSITDKTCNCFIVTAVVTPDVSNPDRTFTGLAYETDDDGFINRKNALENCETSATGRALAKLGYIGAEDKIDAEEVVEKAKLEAIGRPTNNQIEQLNKVMNKCKAAGLLSLTELDRYNESLKTMDMKLWSDTLKAFDNRLVKDKLNSKKDEGDKDENREE